MTPTGNLSFKRILFVIVASPLIGGFVWGALNPPGGWDSFAGRFIHGLLAAPMSLFVMFARPDKVQSWPYIALAFAFLLLLALRFPRDSGAASG